MSVSADPRKGKSCSSLTSKLFLRKVIKTVATRCLDFSSKRPKMRLAAGLCPDPLGELKRSPRPLAAIWGPTSKGRGKRGDEGGKEVERKGGNGKNGEGKGGEREEGGGEGTRTPLTYVWLRG